MTTFENLVREFAAATGLDVQMADGESFSLETEGLTVTVQYRPARDDVAVFACVTDPDASDRIPPATLRRALELGAFGEGTRGRQIGLFKDAIVLSESLPLEGLTPEVLGARLLAFSEVAADVSVDLDAAGRAEPDGAADGEGGAAPPEDCNLSAIRV